MLWTSTQFKPTRTGFQPKTNYFWLQLITVKTLQLLAIRLNILGCNPARVGNGLNLINKKFLSMEHFHTEIQLG